MHIFTLNKSWAELKNRSKTLAVVALIVLSVNCSAQDRQPARQAVAETYGNTLNLSLGFAYYGYIGYSVPMVFANYEIGVARNFTLAPFVGFSTYRSYDYYDYQGYHYYYHETIVPIGVKATYYFDRLLGAGPRWDFYLAASLGFVYDRVVWDNGYGGDQGLSRSASPVYLDGHIGAEYHLNRKVGVFLDLSTGVSTVGLAVHHL